MHAAAAKVQLTVADEWAADRALAMRGAVGCTWERDLQLFYRRTELDTSLFGAPSVWNEWLASALPLLSVGWGVLWGFGLSFGVVNLRLCCASMRGRSAVDFEPTEDHAAIRKAAGDLAGKFDDECRREFARRKGDHCVVNGYKAWISETMESEETLLPGQALWP
ncbi:acyl-CoA dehydrogenase family protein [Streptomyces sp. NPDC058424]|uniref:acyl-CoA dehydrogenase family protein n=1 Tax=Streptomyces sp. NPDC058424 TaxID=3346491 RepID=UPI0036599051